MPVKKIRINWAIPEPLLPNVEALLQTVGDKQHWMMHSAGIIQLLALSEVERTNLILEISRADMTGDF